MGAVTGLSLGYFGFLDWIKRLFCCFRKDDSVSVPSPVPAKNSGSSKKGSKKKRRRKSDLKKEESFFVGPMGLGILTVLGISVIIFLTIYCFYCSDSSEDWDENWDEEWGEEE